MPDLYSNSKTKEAESFQPVEVIPKSLDFNQELYEIIKEPENSKPDLEELNKILDEEIEKAVKSEKIEASKQASTFAKPIEKAKTVAVDNNKLFETMLNLQESINTVDKNVTNRKEENINILKLIFGRLTFIKKHMSKWFAAILIVVYFSGILTGAIIAVNWKSIEPLIDKVVGISKIANNASNITR